MGECSSARSVAGRSGVAFTPCEYPISLFSSMKIVENSEEPYFRLLKGRWRLPYIAASQKARLSQARIALCFGGRKVRDT